MMPIVKDTMKDMSKESLMTDTAIVTDTATMIPVAIMVTMKPDTKKGMKKAMMKAIVKGSLIMREPKKMMIQKKMKIGN